MTSIRIICVDYYMSYPLQEFDKIYSEFRGNEVKQVPVIQIFGTSQSGKKICLHVHGVFPYMYIPYDGSESAQKLSYKIATELDNALNASLGQATSNAQHVSNIVLVSGIPFYGFHEREHQFFKIYFYNPTLLKKACSLLENGLILNKCFQPHESHINYVLQFMIDYNLHGMSFINLSSFKYRQNPDNSLNSGGISQELILPSHIQKRSWCELEMDAHAFNILNKKEATSGLAANPGLAALWEDERQRKRNENLNSQISFCLSQERQNINVTSSHMLHKEKFLEKLSQRFLDKCSDDLNKSVYPAETPKTANILSASSCESSIHENICLTDLNRTIDLTASEIELMNVLCDLKENVDVEEESLLSQQLRNEESNSSDDDANNNMTLPFSNDIWEDSFWNDECCIPQMDGTCDTSDTSDSSLMETTDKFQKKEKPAPSYFCSQYKQGDKSLLIVTCKWCSCSDDKTIANKTPSKDMYIRSRKYKKPFKSVNAMNKVTTKVTQSPKSKVKVLSDFRVQPAGDSIVTWEFYKNNSYNVSVNVADLHETQTHSSNSVIVNDDSYVSDFSELSLTSEDSDLYVAQKSFTNENGLETNESTGREIMSPKESFYFHKNYAEEVVKSSSDVSSVSSLDSEEFNVFAMSNRSSTDTQLKINQDKSGIIENKTNLKQNLNLQDNLNQVQNSLEKKYDSKIQSKQTYAKQIKLNKNFFTSLKTKKKRTDYKAINKKKKYNSYCKAPNSKRFLVNQKEIRKLTTKVNVNKNKPRINNFPMISNKNQLNSDVLVCIPAIEVKLCDTHSLKNDATKKYWRGKGSDSKFEFSHKDFSDSFKSQDGNSQILQICKNIAQNKNNSSDFSVIETENNMVLGFREKRNQHENEFNCDVINDKKSLLSLNKNKINEEHKSEVTTKNIKSETIIDMSTNSDILPETKLDENKTMRTRLWVKLSGENCNNKIAIKTDQETNDLSVSNTNSVINHNHSLKINSSNSAECNNEEITMNEKNILSKNLENVRNSKGGYVLNSIPIFNSQRVKLKEIRQSGKRNINKQLETTYTSKSNSDSFPAQKIINNSKKCCSKKLMRSKNNVSLFMTKSEKNSARNIKENVNKTVTQSNHKKSNGKHKHITGVSDNSNNKKHRMLRNSTKSSQSGSKIQKYFEMSLDGQFDTTSSQESLNLLPKRTRLRRKISSDTKTQKNLKKSANNLYNKTKENKNNFEKLDNLDETVCSHSETRKINITELNKRNTKHVTLSVNSANKNNIQPNVNNDTKKRCQNNFKKKNKNNKNTTVYDDINNDSINFVSSSCTEDEEDVQPLINIKNSIECRDYPQIKTNFVNSMLNETESVRRILKSDSKLQLAYVKVPRIDLEKFIIDHTKINNNQQKLERTPTKLKRKKSVSSPKYNPLPVVIHSPKKKIVHNININENEPDIKRTRINVLNFGPVETIRIENKTQTRRHTLPTFQFSKKKPMKMPQ